MSIFAHGIAIGLGTAISAVAMSYVQFDMNNFWLGALPSIAIPFTIGYIMSPLAKSFK